MRLCQLPRLPSELWNLRSAGYDEETCLDFDLAHITFWDDFEGHRNERKKVTVPQSQRLGPNQAWVPTYAGDGDILRSFYGVGRPAADAPDPIVAALTDDDLATFLPEWDAPEMQA